MGTFSGLIGIYSNPSNPNLELNSSRTSIYFQYDKTFHFLVASDCVVGRKPAYNANSSKGDCPFIFINLKKKKFAFLDFNFTSIYYGFEEVGKNKAKLIEINSRDLPPANKEKRTNEIVDLEKLNWIDLVDFDQALEKYFE